jgi:hypothetical protein
MSLVGQWRELQDGLPEGWIQVAVRLELRAGDAPARAAALLGPAQPYRSGPNMLQFSSARDGSAPSPDGIARLLKKLDDERIGGTLGVLGSERAPARPEREFRSLAAQWDALLAELPDDWSDLLGEINLESSDYVEPAAVLLIQMNPRRVGTSTSMRFRGARRAGYGVSPEMARRCFERCDEANIRGTLEVLRVLSDTHLVATQGPVWIMDGQTV